jgi:hypothetical protein
MVHYGKFEVGETLLPFPSTVSDRLEWTDWSPFSDLGLRTDAGAVVKRAVEISHARGTSRIWLLVGGDSRGFVVAEVMDRMLDPISIRELGYQRCEARCYSVPSREE